MGKKSIATSKTGSKSKTVIHKRGKKLLVTGKIAPKSKVIHAKQSKLNDDLSKSATMNSPSASNPHHLHAILCYLQQDINSSFLKTIHTFKKELALNFGADFAVSGGEKSGTELKFHLKDVVQKELSPDDDSSDSSSSDSDSDCDVKIENGGTKGNTSAEEVVKPNKVEENDSADSSSDSDSSDSSSSDSDSESDSSSSDSNSNSDSKKKEVSTKGIKKVKGTVKPNPSIVAKPSAVQLGVNKKVESGSSSDSDSSESSSDSDSDSVSKNKNGSTQRKAMGKASTKPNTSDITKGSTVQSGVNKKVDSGSSSDSDSSDSSSSDSDTDSEQENGNIAAQGKTKEKGTKKPNPKDGVKSNAVQSSASKKMESDSTSDSDSSDSSSSDESGSKNEQVSKKRKSNFEKVGKPNKGGIAEPMNATDPLVVEKKEDSDSSSDSESSESSSSDSDSSSDVKDVKGSTKGNTKSELVSPNKRRKTDNVVKENSKIVTSDDSDVSDTDVSDVEVSDVSSVEDSSDSDSSSDSSDSDSSSDSSSDEEDRAKYFQAKSDKEAKKKKAAAAAAAAWTPTPPKKMKKVNINVVKGTDGAQALDGGKPFQRVDDQYWGHLAEKDGGAMADNSYGGAFGEAGFGARASDKLLQVRGKRFQHEKTKAKRSYNGFAKTGQGISINESFSTKFKNTD